MRLSFLLAMASLGGCASPVVSPTLSLSERSPDGRVEVLTDSTDPDEGRPAYYLSFRATGDPGQGTPAHCLDGMGSNGRSFGYSSRYVGRHDYEIITEDAPPCRETIRLANGLVVNVTVRGNTKAEREAARSGPSIVANDL